MITDAASSTRQTWVRLLSETPNLQRMTRAELLLASEWLSKAAALTADDYQAQFEALASSFDDQLTDYGKRLASGDISPAEFKQYMGSTIRTTYDRAYRLGASVQAGERAILTDADRATIQGILDDELEYLTAFQRDVSLGFVPDTEAYLTNRAGMYADAIHGLYWQGRTSQVDSESYEAWYEAEPDACEPCAQNASGSPYSVDEVPIPGDDCDGGPRCRCTLRYEAKAMDTAGEADSSEESA